MEKLGKIKLHPHQEEAVRMVQEYAKKHPRICILLGGRGSVSTTADTIIALGATDEAKKTGKMQVRLLKQRPTKDSK